MIQIFPFMPLLAINGRGEKVVLTCGQEQDVYYAIGDICDRKRFGDSCDPKYCQMYENCPATVHKDVDGHQWHVLPYHMRFRDL